MLERIRHWQHWAAVRYASALLTALATTTTVAFGVWTYYQAQRAENLLQTQNRVAFDIVAASAGVGVTLDDIAEKYLAAIPSADAPPDSDILSILLRLTPNVTLVRDRWYVDSSVPLSNLRVFIDDIAFGIPRIPDTYQSRQLSGEDIIGLLSPLQRSDDTISLTTEEAGRLNRIATVSYQAGSRPVSPERNYSMPDVVSLFGSAFGFYYEYTQWERVAREWSEFLSSGDETPIQRIELFVRTQLNNVPDSPGLFAAMVGMAAIGRLGRDGQNEYKLDLDRGNGNCVGPGATSIELIRDSDGDHVIDWGSFTSHIVDSDSPDSRVEAARELTGLFQEACVTSLSRIFAEASTVFGTEHAYMKQYVDEWDRIIAERAAASLTLRITIANVGMFDTYIHRDIRVGVGPRGNDPKILLTLTSVDDAEEGAGGSPYLIIETRTPRTYRFRASLSPDIRERLRGSFASESSYIQAGVVASFGGPNEFVFSPVTPFSARAREQLRREVDEILWHSNSTALTIFCETWGPVWSLSRRISGAAALD